MESSKASLTLQGFVPKDQTSPEELNRRLIEGRYAELRMLFYIGKDLARWTEQCAETAVLSGQFPGRQIRPETFAVCLIQQVPQQVRAKLEAWGVLDFCALFRRSFGLHSVFEELPSAEMLSPEFLRRYHRYLDQWFEQRLRDKVFDRPEVNEFTFDMYASGEYTQMLEKSWVGGSETP